ncbi:MAG: ABC transporter permease [Myxococcales bacterium]|nr:ABC transporter permease [Myxococcales bacterium]MCB0217651.1 ABC transporter permease [Chloroflexota bacterium]MCB9175871.1 ABC transporter permease [Caldilineae bacterium]
MRGLVSLAWRNLWRNWRRTAIALVAIVLGLMLLLLMDGFIQGSDRAIFGNAVRLYGGNVMVHATGYRERASRLPLLPLEDPDAVIAAAEARPEVLHASRRLNSSGLVGGSGGKSQGVLIHGIEPEREAEYSIVAEGVTEGRFLLEGEGDAILIGRGLAERLEIGVGDRIELIARGRGEALHQRGVMVVGIFDLGMREAERGMVFVTLGEAQDLFRLRDGVSEVAITLDELGREQPTIDALQAALPGYEIDSWDSLRPEFKQLLETKAGFTGFIGFVVLLIACIGVLNMMLMSVFERTREMGILAALGMKGRQVMALFLIEGALVGVLGALIGCGLGWAVVSLLGRVGMGFGEIEGMGEITALMGSRIYPWLNPVGILGRGLAVTLIAMLASFYPAWTASRKQPAEVLHHV